MPGTLDHALRIYYQRKAQRLETENRALWNITIALLEKLDAGPTPLPLAEFAEATRQDLLALLETP